MMRGGAVDFLRATGFKFVIANLSSNKKHGAEKLTALKMAALNLQEKFFLDAPGLANDCIDRIEDDNALEHIAQRALTKTTNKQLRAAVYEAGGSGSIVYSTVNDKNNVHVTGMKAKALVIARGEEGKKVATRDLFETRELVKMAYVEVLETEAIQRKRPRGNREIFNLQDQLLKRVKDIENF